MRTLRILLLISSCYLVGWIAADLLVPVVLAGRGEADIANQRVTTMQTDHPAMLAQQP